MANFYQNYYQGKSRATAEGMHIKKFAKLKARSDSKMTGSQEEYHKALFEFLVERGILEKDDLFGKPRSKKDCSLKIHSLNTILYKNGLWDEFYDKKEEEE